MAQTKKTQVKAGIPTHQKTYSLLRKKILYGELQPGCAVTLQGLASEYDVSLTPVREAVRRLISEGALALHDNRRVSIPEMTPDRLDEILQGRRLLEPELAVKALPNVGPDLLDILRAIDTRVDQAIQTGDISGYLENNHAFHFRLYAASGSTILMPLVDKLWMQVGPFLRLVCGRYGTMNLSDEHKQAMQAIENGDAEMLHAAITADIGQGADFIRKEVL